MKKILLLGALLLAVGILKVEAQQDPLFTHYMYNKLVYNPAYAGTRENICATLLYHNQWTNFKSAEDASKAPITQTFSIHGPVNLSSVNLGAGLHVINDNLGFENTTGIMGSFSYRRPIAAINSELSVGVNLGFLQKSLKGKWIAKDPNDPRLPGNVSDPGFDAGLGIYLNNPNWYAGASVLHLPQMPLTWLKGASGQSKVVRTYYFHGGYNYVTPLPKLELQPAFLLKTDLAKTQFSANVIALYDQRYWGGVVYHGADDISLMLGLYTPFIPNLSIGYSFDLPMGENQVFGGKHEVLVNYCFRINVKTEDTYHKSTRFL